MKLSLIISTYNRPDALELVLNSIRAQKLGLDLLPFAVEVLIADDGSTAMTRDLVFEFQRAFPFKLSHIWHADNGFRLAAIRNLAVSKAGGEYLIFIDGDCLVAPDFIYNHYKLAEIGYVVGGNRVLLSKPYSLKVIAKKDISIARAKLSAAIFHKLRGDSNKYLAPLRLNFAASWRKFQELNWRRPKGCNLGLWRADYFKVNGFDESFCGWGHEDADFLIRLLHAGVKIKDGRFAAPVYHLWHAVNDRGHEAANLQRLDKRINDLTCIRAVLGVEQYIKS